MTRPPPTAAELAVSKRLQEVARALEETLREIAGERVGFLLITLALDKPQSNAQFVSNVERADSEYAMRQLLERWAAGLPTPATHKLKGLS